MLSSFYFSVKLLCWLSKCDSIKQAISSSNKEEGCGTMSQFKHKMRQKINYQYLLAIFLAVTSCASIGKELQTNRLTEKIANQDCASQRVKCFNVCDRIQDAKERKNCKSKCWENQYRCVELGRHSARSP